MTTRGSSQRRGHEQYPRADDPPPWAWAISDGPRWTENRLRWMGYRGPLWLHAGTLSLWEWFTFGAVVALVTVADCHHWTECRGRCSEWAARGSFLIRIAGHVIQLADPVPCRGALGLWHLPLMPSRQRSAGPPVRSRRGEHDRQGLPGARQAGNRLQPVA